jgi:adenylyl-sulfate reductase (glutathione)
MAVPVVEVDPVFEGEAGGPGSLIKYNPLSNMSSAETWNFLRAMGVPTNKLHACGYDSIGCEPCTRPVLPNQAEREGRWWWEDSAAKECGLHSGNIKKGENGGEAPKAERDLWAAGSAVESLDKAAVEKLVGGQRDKDTVLVLYAPWCQFCQGMEASYEELAQQLKGGKVRVAKYQADTDKEWAKANAGLTTFPSIVVLPKSGAAFVKYPSERRDADSLGMFVRATTGFA